MCPSETQPLHQLKNRSLDARLPAASELRSYLSGKDETASKDRSPSEVRPHLVPYKKVRSPKTLLVMPPLTLSEGAVKRVIPPLGLSYIAATLRDAGFWVRILDCVAEGAACEQDLGDRTWRLGLAEEHIGKRITEAGPDVIGISVLYSSDLPRLFEVAKVARRVAPHAIIVAGGLHASIYPKDLLSGFDGGTCPIDFVMRGEGEYRLLSFLRCLSEGVLDLNADGLCGFYHGQLFINPQRETIGNLDAISFPGYDLLPMETYFSTNVPFSPFPRGKRVAQVLTSRGCPVGCTFCASTNFLKSYRTRSVTNVIEEIRFLKQRFKIDELQFADDNLTFDRKRSIALFDALQAEKLQWCTPNGIMVNTLNDELLDLMISSGMYQITLSIDGATVRTLKHRHRKPVDLDRVPGLVDYLVDRDVFVHVTLVIGAPGESEDEIREAFDFILDLRATSVGVFIAQALPGSELFEAALHSGRIERSEARRIDTARASGRISDIDPDRLGKLASDFVREFNLACYTRRPGLWKRKYDGHAGRLRNLCIGRPAPNTDGIIAIDDLRTSNLSLLVSDGS